MVRVLVTGATGTLGRHVVRRLVADGHEVRAMTRSTDRAPALMAQGAVAVVGDLTDPTGTAGAAAGVSLTDAVAGVDHVLHLATSPRRDTVRVDVDGTAALLAARDEAAPSAVLTYVSIVGCDRTPLPLYKAKTRAEELVRERDLTHVVRATQFHELVSWLVRVVPGVHRAVVPAGWVLQPVAADDVAAILVDGLEGKLPAEVGGPEVLTFEEIARRRSGAGVLPVPIPGAMSAAVRSGSLLAGPDAVRGTTRLR